MACRGAESDGHDYIPEAIEAGAAVVAVERDVDVPGGVVAVRVDDTRAALAKLAAAYYGLLGEGAERPRLIGITGTNGKTTVAWLLRSMLQAGGRRPALLGTIEYDLLEGPFAAPLTTPGALDLARHLARARAAGADFAVLEVSSHALDQRRADGLTFTAGVFTNLSRDHLDYHGTMESYRRAKRRLFEMLEVPAVAVVNGDDPVAGFMTAAIRARILSFGIGTPAVDVSAHLETLGPSRSTFVLRGRAYEIRVASPLVGRHNVLNVLAAAATAEAVGLGPEAIASGIEGLTGVPGRLQRVVSEPPGAVPFEVLVDYAHTDEALENALSAVRPLTEGRLICVFGCGGDRDRGKRPRMAAVVERLADVAYVTSDNPRTEAPEVIIDDILAGFEAGADCRVETEVDRRCAIELAIAEAKPGDTVLIAGKGHETYQLIGDRVLGFDDVAVARACLAGRRTAEVVEDVA